MVSVSLRAAQKALVHDRFAFQRSSKVVAAGGSRFDGFINSAPRRVLLDGIASPEEVCLLRGVAARTFNAMGYPLDVPDTSLTPLEPALAEEELLGRAGVGLVSRLVGRLSKQALDHGFSMPATGGDDGAVASGNRLELAGTLLSRLCAPGKGEVEANPLGMKGGSYGYWAPHVDKANVEAYDVSAVLYLSSFGEHFDGGHFSFNDTEGVDKLVEPREGRLLLFDSGIDNLHQVYPVCSGERLTLSMWFTRVTKTTTRAE